MSNDLVSSADVASFGDIKTYRKTATVEAVQLKTKFTVQTEEGIMQGNVNDYLCIGIDNEMWPVKKDIFEKTYEVIE